MNPEHMLRNLAEHGEDAASGYNDGLDGWFGWKIAGDLLTITFEADAEDVPSPLSASWRLVPVEDA